MKTKKLKIDLDELCEAFDDSSIEHRYYLDLETGDILFISEDVFHSGFDEEMKELYEKIEEGFGERYISIPQIESYEAYQDMVDFVESIEDENLQEKLYIALDGRGAFRRFKNVLLNHPEERERWFEFKSTKVMERVKEWLEFKGIEVEEEIQKRRSHTYK